MKDDTIRDLIELLRERNTPIAFTLGRITYTHDELAELASYAQIGFEVQAYKRQLTDLFAKATKTELKEHENK